MPEITLRTTDLIIGEYKDKETDEKKEILRLASHLAFDSDFIEEMKAKGVKKIIKDE